MQFQTKHTVYGLQRMAQAEAAGVQLNLVRMAVGDGNGNPIAVSEGQTQLVREIAGTRRPPNRIYRDPVNPAMYIAEMVLPPDIGGFTVREIGIFDDAGGLFAVANTPDMYKPQVTEGAFGDFVVSMRFMVTNANIVTILIDPNIAMASQQWVLNNVKSFPGGLTGQVLMKDSNADFDAHWHDPTKVNVVVTTIEEQQTLAASQTVVNLVKTNTIGLAIYVGGARLPLIAGVDGWQPDANIITRAILGKSYPAGTKIIAVQNEPASQLEAALQQNLNLSDLQDKALSRQNLDVYSRAEADRLMSAGAVVHFASTAAPQGWMKANGAAISRTAYAALFAVIGTTHGAGDGFNTFNLPDLRGEFIRSWDDSRGVDLNRLLGSHQADQNRAHNHDASASTAGQHDHDYMNTDTYFGGSGLAPGTGYVDRDSNLSTSSDGAHTHAITVASSGGTEARPRNVALLACIKF